MKLYKFTDDADCWLVAANDEDEAICVLAEYMNFDVLDTADMPCEHISEERWSEMVTFDEEDEDGVITIPICDLMKGIKTPQIIA